MNIYGKNTVIEALKTRDDVSKIIISTSNHEMIPLVKKLIKNKNIEIQELPLNKMNQMFPKNHQGIVATVNDYQYVQLEKLIEKNQNKQHVAFVILDGLEDPHNLGAILRTCDAIGVDGVIIGKNRSVGLNATVAKVSTGAIHHVKVAQVTNLTRTLEDLKKKSFWIVGCELENSQDYRSVDYNMPTVLVIGSEGFGMSRLVKKSCDINVVLPMEGHVNSLNASVAASVLLYQVYNSRHPL